MIKSSLFESRGFSSKLSNVAWLLLRLHIGLSVAINAGIPKVRVFPAADWFIEQVAELGFPFAPIWAFGAAWLEVLGGIMVAVGLLTRPFALLLAVHFGVAAFLYHKAFPLIDLQIAQLFFWVFIAVGVIGGAKFSVDHLVTTRSQRANSSMDSAT